MRDLVMMTSGEWVLLALVTIGLVHAAVVYFNLHKTLVRVEKRPAFTGLSGALSDVSKRAGRNTNKGDS